MSAEQREGAPVSVVICFAVTVVFAGGFAFSYVWNLGAQALGGCLGGAFVFLALGLGIWSSKVDKAQPDYVEERAVGPSPPETFDAFQKALTDQPVPRQRVLWGMLTVALGSVGGAALFPLRSLFPEKGGSPDAILSHTPWSKGRALVTEEGKKIKPTDLSFNSVLTAFPEGLDPDKNVDTSTLLLRVQPDELRLPPERLAWVVDGVVGYSKLCTHAGCPVGLYSDSYRELLCPCHHSIFDVLRGAIPIEGPAARPLPQLPLGLDKDGYLVATGDFSEPVGPGWWGLPS